MMTINGAPIAANGRIAVDVGVTPVTFNAALGYSVIGALCVAASGTVTAFNGGFGFVGGQLRITDLGGGPLPALVDWNQGLPMDPISHALLCSSTDAIVQWNHGWPQTADGRVCIAGGLPPANAFNSGYDTGYD